MIVNLLDVRPGQWLTMKDGTRLRVTENIGDGIWLKAEDPATGDEVLAYCEEIDGAGDAPAAAA